MGQELYERWGEIQKLNSGNQTAGNALDRLEEELNLLEALRIQGCKTIPGETSNIQALIDDRHRRMDEVLRKRKK